jgi:hypothetical protein
VATDATGTPTAKGIPKYDTTNDAPSGLGFNATMEAIDLLLDKTQFSTDTVSTNEVPVWNGSAWVYSKITDSMLETTLADGPPGQQIDYVELTSTDVAITATTEATANTVVTANSTTFDGTTAVWIETFLVIVRPDNAASNRNIVFSLYDGASSIGLIGQITDPAAATIDVSFSAGRRLTPSAAAHTYSIRAHVNAGTGHVFSGVGGVGAFVPSYIRIKKA